MKLTEVNCIQAASFGEHVNHWNKCTHCAAVCKEQKVNLNHAKEPQSNFLKAHRDPRPADSHLPGFSDLQWVISSHRSKTKKTPKEVKNSSSHLVLLAVTWVVITMITLMRLQGLESKYTGCWCCFYLQCWEEPWKHLRVASAKCPWPSPSLGQHLGQFGPLHLCVLTEPGVLWSYGVRVGLWLQVGPICTSDWLASHSSFSVKQLEGCSVLCQRHRQEQAHISWEKKGLLQATFAPWIWGM